MCDPEQMRDDAFRLAENAGLVFRLDAGPAAPMLERVGLMPVAPPVPVDKAQADEELRLLTILNNRGHRLPAIFEQ